MAWNIGLADHIGGRDEQQDRVEAFVLGDGESCLLVVADGMGGHQGGAVAAQTMIDTARDVMEAVVSESRIRPRDLLKTICLQSHRRINQLGQGEFRSPRCTCSIFFADDDHGHWVSVGDSRLYRFRSDQLLERTRDQSVVQMLVDLGKITEQEMATHPDQNRVLQSLGGDEEPELEFGQAKVKRGDAILLCTDGLWENAEAEEMVAAASAPELEQAANELVERAASRGGPKADNISVALARFGEARARWHWPKL